MITSSAWGGYTLFTLDNGTVRAQIADLGATIVSLRWRGKERVIGFDAPEGYFAADSFPGATVGRYANRIGGAAFTLNGRRYALTANEGKNQLHGGDRPYFHLRRWEAEIRGEALVFTLVSPDGENGFPGTVTAEVRCTLLPDGLRVDYGAVTDADTFYAPTNHSYFDLSGRGDCLSAVLQVNADRYLEVDGENIPVAVRSVEGTRFDLREARRVGENYDHCFVLSGEPACALSDGDCRLRVFTDFPALQVYTGSFLKDPFRPNQAIALEPEFYPDTPNHPEYPSALLRPGERFERYIEYRFD